MELKNLWQQFYFHLQVKKRSPATLRYYHHTEDVLTRYLSEQQVLSLEVLNVTHLRSFLLALEERGLALTTVHAHGRAVRALFNWAEGEELITRNPARRLSLPTLPKERMPTMTGVRVKELLLHCRKGEQPLRDTALVLTLFDTGIRIHELVQLTVDDLHLDRGLLRVMGKGRKERYVPIGAKAMQAVMVYIRRARKPVHTGVKNVFLNRLGEPLTDSGVSIRLAKFATACGWERSLSSPHTFRRGFAVEFLRNGGDVFTLQQILGHSSLDMTRRYVNFLDDDLRAAHLRFSPGDRL